MELKDKAKVNRKIGEILNSFISELNDDITRDKISFKIKSFLEEQNIKWESLNLYTPIEKIDKGFVDINIDGEFYPFKEIDEIDEKNWLEHCFRWETEALNFEDTIKIFQYLINEGHAWNLQEFYRRTAEELIKEGYCTFSKNTVVGNFIWGNTEIPTKYEIKKNAPGTDEYVKKRKELNDQEFFEWSNIQINAEDEGCSCGKGECCCKCF